MNNSICLLSLSILLGTLDMHCASTHTAPAPSSSSRAPYTQQQLTDQLLLLSIDDDDIKLAEKFISMGANVNMPMLLESPLMKAVSVGNEDMVRLLIARGADISASDTFGLTALKMANNMLNPPICNLPGYKKVPVETVRKIITILETHSKGKAATKTETKESPKGEAKSS